MFLNGHRVAWRDGSVVKSTYCQTAMLVQAAGCSTCEGDSTRRVPGQLGMHAETLSQKQTMCCLCVLERTQIQFQAPLGVHNHLQLQFQGIWQSPLVPTGTVDTWYTDEHRQNSCTHKIKINKSHNNSKSMETPRLVCLYFILCDSFYCSKLKQSVSLTTVTIFLFLFLSF